MAIVLLTETKEALGISGSDEDTRLMRLTHMASGVAERISGRAWTQAEVTERHQGGVQALPLRRYPVASVSTVTDKSSGEVMAATGYEIETTTGLLYRLPYGRWWDGYAPSPVFQTGGGGSASFPRWEVTYTGGPSSAPEDIRAAVIEIIAHMRNAQGGMQSEKDGDYSYSMAATPAGVPPTVMAVLSRYAGAPV